MKERHKMSEFDKWLKRFYKNHQGDRRFEPTSKMGWKAAMEQVLLWGSDDDVLFNKIKDEIYGA